jgi:hypothetical protein
MAGHGRFLLRLSLTALALLFATGLQARIWHVSPDGSGDALTIHAGLDSSRAGDTVLVVCGTYYENGVDPKSGVALISETGDPDCVTIDAQWRSEAIIAVACDQPTVIAGFTLTHGRPSGNWPTNGGGIDCMNSASLKVENCVFVDNVADYGGGICAIASSVSIIDCVFLKNRGLSGGGLFNDSPVVVSGCVFDSNLAYNGGAIKCGPGGGLAMSNCTLFNNVGYDQGSGVHLVQLAHPVSITNTIIAGGSSGEGIWWDGRRTVETSCCDIWGNAGGDWVGPLANRLGVNGNFSADPRFCDPMTGNLRLGTCSPCLPGHHPAGYDCGGVIGAFGPECDCGTATQPTTWGAIKTIYR